MGQGYTKLLKQRLLEHGCRFLRKGKGDHEIWLCPNARRPIVVDGKIMSRAVANAVLKQAGIEEKFS
jgi:hypothetical protein